MLNDISYKAKTMSTFGKKAWKLEIYEKLTFPITNTTNSFTQTFEGT